MCPTGHSFPIEGGIPRFVASDSYAAAFGPQWIRYKKTQLDSHTGLPLSQSRAMRCIGESGWSSLDGASVLECGCGAGRFTEVLLQQGAHLTSIDLSTAVEANQANFPQSTQHRIAQADIMALPFKGRGFDVVFCLGVLQHTPVPEATILALFQHVRPGGLLVLDHYSYNLSFMGYCLGPQPLARAVLRRLPPATGLRATEFLVGVTWPMHSRLRRYRRLLNRISPVNTYFDLIPTLSDDDQKHWALLDTHDALTDHYKWRRTPREIRRGLQGTGAVGISVWRGGNGVEARGRRPTNLADQFISTNEGASD